VIVPASTFGFSSLAEVERYFETGEGFLYSRYANPTVRQVERFIADLEGADDAALFGSGMAAITTVFLTFCGSGQRVAAQRVLYGGTADLLQSDLDALGIQVRWFDLEQLSRLEPNDLKGFELLFLETPVNPTLGLVDLERATSVARNAGVPVAVDSTFATPILQRPLKRGADLVLHSATKYLGGHSDLIGGVVAGGAELIERISRKRRSLGGTIDPFSAFLLHRGLRTLAVRMQAHCESALAVAQALEDRAGVESVHYPGLPGHPDHALARRQMDGFGGMVSFTVGGGAEAVQRVHDRLELFVKAGSLGGVESLVSIPARMSHRYLNDEARRKIGVQDNLVRLSIGLESPADLIADLHQALG
jgi:cystathionine beta-lyase/cystathionine gamma-synthase